MPDESPHSPPPYHRRVYDPALADLYQRVGAMEDECDLVNARLLILEKDKEIAAAVKVALEGYTETAWTRRQRFVTLGAALFGGIGTIVSIWIGIHGGSF
jgi:hypothetical protein